MAGGSNRQEDRVQPLFLQAVHPPRRTRLDPRNTNITCNHKIIRLIPVHHRTYLPEDRTTACHSSSTHTRRSTTGETRRSTRYQQTLNTPPITSTPKITRFPMKPLQLSSGPKCYRNTRQIGTNTPSMKSRGSSVAGGAWHLKSYSVNDAGQVHAYICDLRYLPYQEQLHWKSHNEEPRGGISKRAYENDFEGTWGSEATPLERILHTLRQWNERNTDWWQIKDEALLVTINTPVSSSKDEWAQSFLGLSIAVIENFKAKSIQAILRQEKIAFEKSDRTLTLLEKLLQSRGSVEGDKTRLEGLRQAQLIRSKIQSHSRGTEATEIARNALLEHCTYREHFNKVCDQISDELEKIEEAFGAARETGHTSMNTSTQDAEKISRTPRHYESEEAQG